jgi:hypothetical protein
MGSAAGGVDCEEQAQTKPRVTAEKMLKMRMPAIYTGARWPGSAIFVAAGA